MAGTQLCLRCVGALDAIVSADISVPAAKPEPASLPRRSPHLRFV